MAEVPAEIVVTNHVMGLYELAAIHLAADATRPARQAALAIDAVACLVEGLGDRLGPDAATMRDALANIRLAFVQIKGAAAERRSRDRRAEPPDRRRTHSTAVGRRHTLAAQPLPPARARGRAPAARSS